MASFLSTRLKSKRDTVWCPFCFWRRHPLEPAPQAKRSGIRFAFAARRSASSLVRRRACESSHEVRNSGIRLQCILTKKMPTGKPEIFSGFFVLRRFSALCAQSAAFLEIRILAKIKRCQSTFLAKRAEENLFCIFCRCQMPKSPCGWDLNLNNRFFQGRFCNFLRKIFSFFVLMWQSICFDASFHM